MLPKSFHVAPLVLAIRPHYSLIKASRLWDYLIDNEILSCRIMEEVGAETKKIIILEPAWCYEGARHASFRSACRLPLNGPSTLRVRLLSAQQQLHPVKRAGFTLLVQLPPAWQTSLFSHHYPRLDFKDFVISISLLLHLLLSRLLLRLLSKVLHSSIRAGIIPESFAGGDQTDQDFGLHLVNCGACQCFFLRLGLNWRTCGSRRLLSGGLQRFLADESSG